MAADPSAATDVLVVLTLRGGFDGVNAIVPAGDPCYLQHRPTIGIPNGSLLALDTMFGLHPALAPLLPYWQAGTFGAVHAVGQVSPTRSHFEAEEEMQRAAPTSNLRTGWLDRALGLREIGPIFQTVQLGDNLPSLALAGPSQELVLGSVEGFHLAGMSGNDDPAWVNSELSKWTTAISSMYVGASANLEQPVSAAMSAVRTTTTMAASAYSSSVTYPDTELARSMKDIARLVKADLGVQVVCVDYDNWDMHEGMGRIGDADGWLNRQLGEVAGALAAFAQDLGPKFNNTTLVTLSEFGRRVIENDSGGVDHGHGNAMLLLGGNVVGGRVHGTWPGLAPAQLDDGDLAGTTDYRNVLAEILQKRCGQSGLSTIFPGANLTSQLGVVRP